jgi:hypothetical protein
MPSKSPVKISDLAQEDKDLLKTIVFFGIKPGICDLDSFLETQPHLVKKYEKLHGSTGKRIFQKQKGQWDRYKFNTREQHFVFAKHTKPALDFIYSKGGNRRPLITLFVQQNISYPLSYFPLLCILQCQQTSKLIAILSLQWEILIPKYPTPLLQVHHFCVSHYNVTAEF